MSSSTAATQTPKATVQETRFFYFIVKNMNTQPQVDWDAVARDAGYNNGKTAMARFRTIKKRLGIDMAKPGTAPANPPTKVTKRGAQSTPAGKAVKRAKNHHDDVDDGSEGDEGYHIKPEPEVKKEIKSEEVIILDD
ncbi:hypothetical protein PG994_001396 [Apiospora phragmitis]|uniref:Myb-like DNA-binding domain-containing protein n=1 Tax=Apiospora phragmitis TaxID=2905665 RepID=A0ABR1WTD9_9PEZI